MAPVQDNHYQKPEDGKLPAGDTGNASNPTPHGEKMEPSGSNQLLNKKAETYLRESGNIEDLPDPQEEQDADETLEDENRNQPDKSE